MKILKMYIILIIIMLSITFYLNINIVSTFWFILTLIPCIEILLFSYKKKIFNKSTWKVLFGLYFVFSIFYEVIRPILIGGFTINMEIIFSILVSFSLWIGGYYYAFKFFDSVDE